MLKIWLIGFILFIGGYYALVHKTMAYAKQNENFAKILDKIEEAKRPTEDTSLGSGAKFIVAMCPILNLIFGVTFWAICLVDSMWDLYINTWFEKF